MSFPVLNRADGDRCYGNITSTRCVISSGCWGGRKLPITLKHSGNRRSFREEAPQKGSQSQPKWLSWRSQEALLQTHHGPSAAAFPRGRKSGAAQPLREMTADEAAENETHGKQSPDSGAHRSFNYGCCQQMVLQMDPHTHRCRCVAHALCPSP